MSNKAQLIALLNKQLYAKNPQLAVADAADTQLMAPILARFIDNLTAVKPIVGEDYFTDADKAMFYTALYEALRAAIKDGIDGKDARKQVFTGRDLPSNPQKGDIWYQD